MIKRVKLSSSFYQITSAEQWWGSTLAQWPCAQRSFILRNVLPRHHFNYLVVFNFLTDLSCILEAVGLTAWRKANSLSARYKIIEEPRLEGTLLEPFCGKGSLDEIICHSVQLHLVNLWWWEHCHVPGEEVKHEEPSSFPQLWMWM